MKAGTQQVYSRSRAGVGVIWFIVYSDIPSRFFVLGLSEASRSTPLLGWTNPYRLQLLPVNVSLIQGEELGLAWQKFCPSNAVSQQCQD